MLRGACEQYDRKCRLWRLVLAATISGGLAQSVLLGQGWISQRTPRPTTAPRLIARPARVHNRFDRALTEAACCRVQALLASSRDRDAMEAWDPDAIARMDQEVLRRQLMSCDRTGNLHQARSLAVVAARLARTSDEKYLTANLLFLVDRDLGREELALEHARKLVSLRPRCRAAYETLWCAAKAAHRTALLRQVDYGLKMVRPGGLTASGTASESKR